jgi:mannose-6-phosphate isomerase-like protein (cupin superfamily)
VTGLGIFIEFEVPLAAGEVEHDRACHLGELLDAFDLADADVVDGSYLDLLRQDGRSIVHRPSGDPARVQQLGPYHIESLIDWAEEGAFTCYRVQIAAGETTSVSFHRIAEEMYFVLAGSGVARFDGRDYPLHTGDFVRLPPGTTHGFHAGPDGLTMLDLHAPGSRPDRDVYFVGPPPSGFGPANA